MTPPGTAEDDQPAALSHAPLETPVKIAYTLLVVLDVDEDDEAGRELRELAAQLRLAAHHLVTEGAPEPNSTVRLSTDGMPGTLLHASLSAVELQWPAP